MGWTAAQFRTARELADRADQSRRRLRGGVGWLLTEPAFLHEVAAVRHLYEAIPAGGRPRFPLARSCRSPAEPTGGLRHVRRRARGPARPLGADVARRLGPAGPAGAASARPPARPSRRPAGPRGVRVRPGPLPAPGRRRTAAAGGRVPAAAGGPARGSTRASPATPTTRRTGRCSASSTSSGRPPPVRPPAPRPGRRDRGGRRGRPRPQH